MSFKRQKACISKRLFLSISLLMIDPGFQVDTLEDTSVTIAPSAPSGYTCTPPIPQGELTTSGTLMIFSGLDTSDGGEYKCASDDVNGTVVIDLDIVGMY